MRVQGETWADSGCFVVFFEGGDVITLSVAPLPPRSEGLKRSPYYLSPFNVHQRAGPSRQETKGSDQAF